MTHNLFSFVAQLALISMTVVLSLSPIILAAFLSGQAQGFGGVL